jgi:hypothetical protein
MPAPCPRLPSPGVAGTRLRGDEMKSLGRRRHCTVRDFWDGFSLYYYSICLRIRAYLKRTRPKRPECLGVMDTRPKRPAFNHGFSSELGESRAARLPDCAIAA